MSFLAAFAKAAAPSLVSGLFGRKQKETRTTPDLQGLVTEAQAAGFNPLTALRSGSAGYTTVNPALSSQEVLGNAVAAGLGSALMHDPILEETKELERDLLEAQLEEYKAGERTFVPGVRTQETRSNPRGPKIPPQSPGIPGDPPAPTQLGVGFDPRLFDQEGERPELETLAMGTALRGDLAHEAGSIVMSNLLPFSERKKTELANQARVRRSRRQEFWDGVLSETEQLRDEVTGQSPSTRKSYSDMFRELGHGAYTPFIPNQNTRHYRRRNYPSF